MADTNDHSAQNNGQDTAQRFGNVLSQEEQRALSRDKARKTYLNLGQDLENLNRYAKNLDDLFEERTYWFRKTTRGLKEAYEEAKRNYEETGNIDYKIESMQLKGDIEAEVEAYKTFRRGLKERYQELEVGLHTATDALERLNGEFVKTYGIGIAESLNTILDLEEETEKLEQSKEAIRLAKKGMTAELHKMRTIQERLGELYAQGGTRDEIDSALEELEEARSEYERYQNASLKSRAQQRASKRRLWEAGLNEDGSERSVQENQSQYVQDVIGGNIAGLGARIGARFGPAGLVIGTLAGAAVGGKVSGMGAEDAMAEGYGTLKDMAEDPLEDGLIPEQLEEIVGNLGPVGEILQVADSILEVTGAIRKQMIQYIDQAAEQLESYFGTINANLEQSAYTYKAISEKADNFLTTSRWVKQTDYLSKIAEVSNAGLLRDIETAAMLQAIKDKTLTSFDATNEGIQRLIRLNESDYIRQFGIETQLKKVLNSVVNDSGYLQSMFDSVTSAIMDAASAYSGDVTAFNSTVQTWMGFMYSAGLNSNVINQIAEGINNLGSGNLEALSGNEQTQRLFLLAMDRVGMDYADILQQGLSLDDTNTLLTSIVQYLDEIVSNTGNNNVLRSSYANLFNLSISDMKAIHQLSSQATSIGNYAVGSGGAITQTVNALTNTLQQSTSISEEFNNLFKNLQYTLGESVAESTAKYSVYKIAEETMKVLQPFADLGGGIGAVAKVAQKAAGVAEFPILALSLINLMGEAGTSILNNTAGGGLTAFLSSSLLNNVSSADNATLTTMLATANSTSSSNSAQLRTINRTTLMNGGMDTYMNTYSQEELEKADEDTKEVKILTEMAKTLMQTKEEGHYAFAVSLEGMNNNVLRSFASIFADEDAMENTFTGENAAIKDSLFNYLDDSTSNTSTADAAKTAVAKGNVSTSDVKKAETLAKK